MAAFAYLAEKKILCDADVDAADLHLITAPVNAERHDFQGGNEAIINKDGCTECGLCRDLCKWEAISENYEVDPLSCEGCGVCVYFCPEKTIDFPQKKCGEWYVSDTRFGPMVHARLGIAEENSGKLVTIVRQEAKKLSEKENLDLILTDGPPGIGCPVIASIGGASAVIIVTEPTLSGKHDLLRVAELSSHFKVPAMVCVNKFDLNPEMTLEIERTAGEKGLMLMGRIPFDPVFTEAMVQGKTIFEYAIKSSAADSVLNIWSKIMQNL
jgi:MinD superfamily P-loop ATPase